MTDLDLARRRLEATGAILRDLLSDNLDNPRIVDQVHQLINHILVVRSSISEEALQLLIEDAISAACTETEHLYKCGCDTPYRFGCTG